MGRDKTKSKDKETRQRWTHVNGETEVNEDRLLYTYLDRHRRRFGRKMSLRTVFHRSAEVLESLARKESPWGNEVFRP